MSYVNNAPLIEAWDTRVSALKAKFATLTDGSTTNVVIEDTSSNVLLSSMSVDGLTLDSNEQAPQITLDAPALVLEPEEGSDESDQEEEEEDAVEETVEETSEETEEEEVVSEDTEE